MFRLFVLLHRYLGLAIGLMLIIWCLSGIIMLYVQFPVVDEDLRISQLPPLDLSECCQLPRDEADDQTVDYFRIEMMGTTPIVRMGWYPDDETGIYLDRGEWFYVVRENEVMQTTLSAITQIGLNTEPTYLGAIENDQWTIAADYYYHRPLHHFALNDEAGTEWYVSGYSGEIILTTTAHQRFWSWPGAVTHWLYFPIIRNQGDIWSNTIIWLSILGTFLTVVGIYLGITKFRFKKSNKPRSPYKGWWMWHHYTGLIFGLFTLTFVFSGLMSMTPFGLFQSEGHQEAFESVRGEAMSWDAVVNLIVSISQKELPEDTRAIVVNTVYGEPALTVYDGDNRGTRYDISSMEPTSISDQTWRDISSSLGADFKDTDMLYDGDVYYFNHHIKRPFPVYRVIVNDDQNTRYYLNGITGEVLSKIDTPYKQYRWLFLALHRGDFHALLRMRPVWDIVMLVLLVGVTIVCVTGFYSGVKRYL